MNTNGKATPSSKATHTLYHSPHAGTPSLLLDKLNARKSTPDSEALASSDDEVESQRLPNLDDVFASVQKQKPARRPSWLNETNHSVPTDSASHTTLTPTRAHPGPLSLWSPGIWGNDSSRKDSAARLAAEILPSPTSVYPPGSNGHGHGGVNFYEASAQSSTRPRDNTVGSIPFAIPLQPTLKTMRSMSYSVGQQEYDSLISPNLPGSAMASTFASRRDRQHSHATALQHRPSRPSMLSEVSNENNGLANLREVEDDGESTNDGSSTQGGVGLPPAPSSQATERTIELLTRENAMLRQQQNFQAVRPRPRAPSVSAMTSNYSIPAGRGMRDSLLEESDYAVDENDEVAELQGVGQRTVPGRRMSEYSAVQGLPPHMTIENRKLESLKKGAWSTSPGFGGLSDIPQSRRHSFADTLPTRQGSVGSIGDTLTITQDHLADDSLALATNRYHEGNGQSLNDPGKQALSHRRSNTVSTSTSSIQYERFVQEQEATMKAQHLQDRKAASTYFATGSTMGFRPQENYNRQLSLYQPSYRHFGNGPRPDQPLFVVLFKCSRADIFYIQDDTGLEVKAGELVIVEADRGTDLGTVAHENVTWAEAKKFKDHYAEEHYKWLMMYSATSVNNPDGSACAGLMAAGNGVMPSAIGGMGPQNNMQESPASDIKPKVIKRVAQAHEIQSLRDKEGNEAKAKRSCTQKVKEHQLKMEILDAELQMDNKKLTFYYFAESYVNFNQLVTDLFKLFKTRIWMSAINPASFATPSVGLQAPSGIGPGAVGVQNVVPDRRRSQEYSGRNYNAGYAPVSQALVPHQSPMYATAQNDYSYGYTPSPFGAVPRNMTPMNPMTGHMASFNPGMMPQQIDPYTPGYITPPNFQQARYPSPHGAMLQNDYGRQGNGGGEGWMSAFQGLSMNSR